MEEVKDEQRNINYDDELDEFEEEDDEYIHNNYEGADETPNIEPISIDRSVALLRKRLHFSRDCASINNYTINKGETRHLKRTLKQYSKQSLKSRKKLSHILLYCPPFFCKYVQKHVELQHCFEEPRKPCGKNPSKLLTKTLKANNNLRVFDFEYHSIPFDLQILNFLPKLRN